MMRLSNYTPMSNDVLVKVEQSTISPGGIIMSTPQKDMIVEVLKVGSLVDNTISVGKHVLLMGNGFQFPMEDENGDPILVIQASVHNITGIYDKQEDENIVFLVNEGGEPVPEEKPGPKNIIDNVGIDKGSFLKEQQIIGEA